MEIKPDVVVYIACAMSERDKVEMVHRAKKVCEIFRYYGITPISPVIEEGVKEESGKLINSNKERLYSFWKRDKKIIIEKAHVVLFDHAEMKSFGMEREYALNRGVLWKPSISYIPVGHHTSVAQFEDDKIFHSIHEAAEYIVKMWGTSTRRRLWRLKMLNKSLLRWLWWQILAFR